MEVATLKKVMRLGGPVVITNHQNPDGDAMGAALGLHRVLTRVGFDSKVVVPNAYPDFLHWMTGHKEVVNCEAHPRVAKRLFKEAKVIFVLDYNAPSRSGCLEPLFQETKATIVMVDHHREPDESFADIMYSDPSKSSTSQMIFELIRELGHLEYLDREGAECLFTGIMTDTGSFRFSSTTPSTLMVAADLLARGVKPHMIHEKIYDTNSENRMRLLGRMLEDMDYVKELNTTILFLGKSDLKKFHYQRGDSEGFVNYGLSMTGVKLSAFFREEEDKVKISFRSKGTFDVNTLARTHFNGGGHLNAAGGSFDGSLKKAIEKFKSILPEYAKELK
ncbi:MAG: bifunctional oligoribonuclease/PAP phosphatase NrnA [Bacteroidota bacterium]|nr:bifunctional oligoribonuclease/PAP phosphatase NrnA [Bacteroidota bacterium]MDX5449115.1 bifunctional oligoribonuclease/PAP phosphatase NrnA [Bacteroidota bacterium]MDX5505591.1 bifunctional oligoribonuclease/PAP phosphatase NrnA [Bacteroidota bacterium]